MYCANKAIPYRIQIKGNFCLISTKRLEATTLEDATTKPFSQPPYVLSKWTLNVIFCGSLRSLKGREQSKHSNSILFAQRINYLYLKFQIMERKGELAVMQKPAAGEAADGAWEVSRGLLNRSKCNRIKTRNASFCIVKNYFYVLKY